MRCNIATSGKLSTTHFSFNDLPLVCPKGPVYSAAREPSQKPENGL
jgi:hypothetical protein